MIFARNKDEGTLAFKSFRQKNEIEVIGNVSSTISIVSLTCIPTFQGYSLEELRLIDYNYKGKMNGTNRVYATNPPERLTDFSNTTGINLENNGMNNQSTYSPFSTTTNTNANANTFFNQQQYANPNQLTLSFKYPDSTNQSCFNNPFISSNNNFNNHITPSNSSSFGNTNNPFQVYNGNPFSTQHTENNRTISSNPFATMTTNSNNINSTFNKQLNCFSNEMSFPTNTVNNGTINNSSPFNPFINTSNHLVNNTNNMNSSNNNPFINTGANPFINTGTNAFNNAGANPFINTGTNAFNNAGTNPFINTSTNPFNPTSNATFSSNDTKATLLNPFNPFNLPRNYISNSPFYIEPNKNEPNSSFTQPITNIFDKHINKLNQISESIKSLCPPSFYYPFQNNSPDPFQTNPFSVVSATHTISYSNDNKIDKQDFKIKIKPKIKEEEDSSFNMKKIEQYLQEILRQKNLNEANDNDALQENNSGILSKSNKMKIEQKPKCKIYRTIKLHWLNQPTSITSSINRIVFNDNKTTLRDIKSYIMKQIINRNHSLFFFLVDDILLYINNDKTPLENIRDIINDTIWFEVKKKESKGESIDLSPNSLNQYEG